MKNLKINMMSDFSIIIPIFNEGKNINKLIDEILLIDSINGYEIIIVNDGGTDSINKDNFNFGHKDIKLRIVNHLKNYGQSYSIRSGIIESTYQTIVTIDGDCQNDPNDIPNLLNIYTKANNNCLVQGQRILRKDNLNKKLASKFANIIRSLILNDKCIDSGCGLKIFNKNDYFKIPFFNHMHRFMPYLFIKFEIPVIYESVNHRHRYYGKSKYNNFKRLINGIVDLLGVIWLTKRNLLVKYKDEK